MADLIIEFYNEEMPASFLKESVNNIKNLIKNRIIKENIKFEKEEWFFTPKRITIIFYNLKLKHDKSKNFIKGPRYDSPEKAIIGFAKSLNTNKNNLIIEDTDKGKYYFFKNHIKPDIKKLLSNVIQTELKKVTWKKSMKWGTNNLRWARPLKNILCLYDNRKLTFSLGHLFSGNKTLQDYQLTEKQHIVKSITHYFNLIEKFGVIISEEERKIKILSDGAKISKNKNLIMGEDEKLLSEVASLVEKPYLFLAKFRENYLKLPQEILITTMKKNQKYFPLYDSNKRLSNYFLLVSNIKSNDKGKVIIEGNQRVVNARLEDASFFWKRDIKNNFLDYFDKLEKIIFHNELGNIKQKVLRLDELALFLSKRLHLDKSAKKDFLDSVKLLKNDLATEAVKEFPELQGVMGSYYAKESKYNKNVCNAIYEHYKPLGPNDKLPKTNLAKLVALIDKIDSIVGFFMIGRQPTSSKDPLALRRNALGIIRIVTEGKIDISFTEIVQKSIDSYKKSVLQKTMLSSKLIEEVKNKVLNFILERYENLIKENDSYNISIFQSLSINNQKLNLLNINNNILYLSSFFKTRPGLKLLNAIKRVTNIINTEDDIHKESMIYPDTKLFKSKEEKKLFELTKNHTKNNITNYKELIKNLSFLINPIENFFDNVQIHHQNTDLKNNRLLLVLFVNNRVNKDINFLNLIKGN
ncbi:MAG: Glycine--tRNA ligase beta subunit [Alphaproteobacteria bacterium MarineAlpha9_Bin4]|nr:glycine--tRNA ligase subunit beta [Pelagibacterales bacterium]PPR26497.1 MAG: Glycine--tRNA ligase beta subunit [Alphaproteobacteria bacterium MarineAlpha9_Bin4]|tara:strand:+ start:1010 stop:3094 length:2085 start_codon:yes stop_codon:yes gene_type:complete